MVLGVSKVSFKSGSLRQRMDVSQNLRPADHKMMFRRLGIQRCAKFDPCPNPWCTRGVCEGNHVSLGCKKPSYPVFLA